MKKTTSSRRKRWFFARAMARAYSEWLQKRTRKSSKASSRPLFAEALEPRVLFSGTPVPVEDQDTASANAAGEVAAQTAVLVDEGIEQIGEFSFESDIDADFTEQDLERLAAEAAARWEKTGLTEEQIDALESINYAVADLEGSVIGAADGNSIFLDVDAAGREWFVDGTEWLDEEFVEIDGLLRAATGDVTAAEGVDLLSVIMHEQGHILGLEDLSDGQWDDVMFSHLGEGVRRLAAEGQADGSVAGSLDGVHFLTAADDSYDTLSSGTLNVSAAGGLLANDDIGAADRVTTDDLTLDYNANDPNAVTGGAAPFTWTPNSGNAGDDFVLNANITYDAVTGDREGITNTFTFTNGGATNRGINDLAGDPSDASASFEFWIKPDAGTDRDRIYEVGGSGDGMAVYWNGSTNNIDWIIDDGNVQQTISGGSAVIDLSQHNQIVLVYAKNDSGTTDRMELYVNGQSVAVDSSNTILDDFDGGDTASLGQTGTGLAATANVGGDTNYEGQMSIFRFYESPLTAAQVTANFNAVDSPAPAVINAGADAGNLNSTGNPLVGGGATFATARGATVTVNPDGSFSYDPTAGLSGSGTTDTFVYEVRDFAGAVTEQRTVTINIDTVPVSGEITTTISEQETATVNVIESQLQQLTNLDANASIIQLQRYGHSVAVDGDLAVIGSDDTGGNSYVLVYERSAGGVWEFKQALADPDGINSNDDFGYDVAVDGQTKTIVVGAYLDDSGPGNDGGAVYVFTDTDDDDTWTLSQQFDGTAGGALPGIDGGDSLGISVDIDNDGAGNLRIVAGANVADNWNPATGNFPTGADNFGAVYVFRDTSGGTDGSNFAFEQSLVIEDLADRNNDDNVGRGVRIDGGYIVAAAANDDAAGTNHGAAYVFQLDATASHGVIEIDVAGVPTANSGLSFTSVGVNNAVTIQYVVGAAGTATTTAAAVGDDITVTLASVDGVATTATAADVKAAIEGDVSTNALVTVAFTGVDGSGLVSATNVVSLGQWNQTAKLINPIAIANSDNLSDVSVTATSQVDGKARIIAGANANDLNGTNAGAALIYVENSPGNWVLEDILQSEFIAGDDRFGLEVDIAGDTALIGAFADDANGETNRGSAFLFQQDTTQASALIFSGTNNSSVRVYVADTDAIDAVSVSFINPGALTATTNAALNGNVIEVTLAHDGTAITATGAEVAAAINAAALMIDVGNGAVAITAETPSNNNGLTLGNGAGIVAATASPVSMTAHWAQQAQLEGSGSGDINDREQFGRGLALGSDGADGIRIFAGSPFRDTFLPGETVTVSGGAAEAVKIGEFGGAHVFEGSRTDIAGTIAEVQEIKPEEIADATDHILSRLTGINEYGLSVDIAGDIAIVGAPGGGGQGLQEGSSIGDNTGDVYVFQRDTKGTFDTSDDTWTLLQTLRAVSEPGASDDFGRDVAVSEDGSTIAVGAPLLDHNGTYTDVGALYIFSRNADGSYFQDGFSHFTGGHDTNGQDEANRLGFNLDINADGSRIVAGAYQEEIDVNLDGAKQNSVGAVYIFDRPGGVGSWTNFNLQQGDAEGTTALPAQPAGVTRIVASDGLSGDQFGRDVSISDDGNRIVVGAFGSDTGGNNRGALYTYDLSNADSTLWAVTEAKIQPAAVLDNDQVGLRVDLGGTGGEWFVASGHLDDGNGNSAGVAYVYKLDGGAYVLQQELSAAGSGATLTNAEFGRAVSVNEEGTLIAVGARVNDTFGGDVGAIFLFERDDTQVLGSQWVLKDGPLIDENRDARGVVDGSDQFGRAIAISGNTVVAGGYNADFVLGNTDVRNYGNVAAFEVSPLSPAGGALTVKAGGFSAITNESNPGRTNNGSVSFVGDEVTFDPGSDFDDLKLGESEVVTFTYTLEDATNGLEGTGTIRVTVQGATDTVAINDAVTITENETNPAYNLITDVADTVATGANYDFVADGTQTAGSWTGTGGTFTADTANGVTFGTTTSAFGGITHSYTLPGNTVQVPAQGDRGLDFVNPFGTGSAASGTVDTAWEVWIKPTSLTGGNQVLAETGGGTGMGLFLNNSVVEVRAVGGGSSGALASFDITGLEGEFIQIVGIAEINGDLTLYVNGEEVDRAVGSIGTDWDGGDGAALGTRGGANMGGVGGGSSNRVSFAGEIAIFRQYNAANVLDGAGVAQNFRATAGGDLNVTGVTPFEITNPGTVTSTQGVNVTLNADGSFVYNSGTTWDSLAAGDTATDSFDYELVDSTGTVTLNITGVNDAPVLDNSGTVTFTSIDENNTTNNGNLVSELLDLSGTPIATDADTVALFGIAVTGASITSGAGVWEYSIDNGGNWNALGSPTELAALLLRSEDRLRFVPDTIDAADASVTFRAWDQTDGGTAGTTAIVTTNGGETAFSAADESASITVTAVNENPVATNDDLTTSNQVTLNANIITADNGNGVDSDEEAGVLNVATVNGAAGNIGVNIDTAKGGRFNVAADGTLTYEVIGGTMATLSGGATDTDTITYTIVDADTGTSNTATVTVTVVGANKPNGVDDSYNANEDTALVVPDGAGDLLDNDSIGGGDAGDLPLVVDIAASDAVSAAGATITYTGTANEGDGGFTYDATNSALIQSLAAGETYADTFNYTVDSARGVPDIVQVTINVTGQGAIEIDSNFVMPPAFTTTNPGDDATPDTYEVGISGGIFTITVNGEVLRSTAEANVSGADIQIAGSGDIDTVTLTALSSQTFGAITVDSSIETLNVDGAISAGSFTTTAGSNVVGADITTTGNQQFNTAVIFDGDATLAGTDIVFANTIEDDSNSRDLTVNATGVARFMNTVGAMLPLGSLDTSGSATTEFGTGYDVLQGNAVWDFDFSKDPDTGDNVLPESIGTIGTGGGDFQLLLDTDNAGATASFVDISATSGHVGLTRAADFPGGALGVNGDGGFRIQQGTTDTSPDAVAGLTNGPATFDMWVKFDDIGSVATPTTAQVLWETGGGTGWGLALSDTGQLVLRLAAGGATATYDLASDPSNGDFVHIAAQVDLSADPDTVTLFVNGAQVGQGSVATQNTTDWDGGDPSALGATGGANLGGFGGGNTNFPDLIASGTGTVESFNGQIAAFRMYDGLLSLAEIQANMNLADNTTQPPAVVTVSTSGVQSFGNAVVGLNTSLSGSAVTFNGTLDDDGATASTSEVTVSASTGNILFDGAVGGGNEITQLEATAAAGTIHVHGGSVTTTKAQTYNTAVHTNATGVTYTSTSALGDITFADTLTSVGALTVNSGGDLTVTGAADFQSTADLDGDIVTFASTTSLGGALTVTASDDATFTGAVTGAGHDVIANVNDRLTFGAGATVSSITSSVSGRAQLNGTFTLDSSTTDSTFADDVVLQDNVTFNTTGTSNLIFGGAVDSETGSAFDLTIDVANAAALVAFAGDIGGDQLAGDTNDAGLGSLTTTGAGNVVFAGKGNSLAGLPNPMLNFNASFDQDVTVWEDLAGNMNLTSTGAAALGGVDTSVGGISQAYTLTGGKAQNTGASGDINTISGNPTDEDATIEWWIRPTDLTGQEIIWETGGTGSGQALVLNDGVILFTAKEAEGANTVGTVSYDLAGDASNVLGGAAISDDLMHVVVVYNRNTASNSAEDDTLTLFINGKQVDTDSANLDDFAGTDRTGLGGAGNSVGGSDTVATTDLDSVDVTSGYGNFAGDIAVMRWYRTNSNATTVGNMYTHMQSAQLVNTTGAVSLANNTTLGGNVSITSSGSGDVSFNGTVDGAHDLAVNTGGATSFGANVGSGTALESVTTNTGGSVSISGDVTTAGTQTFGEAATVTTSSTLTGTDISFGDGMDLVAAGVGTLTVSGNLAIDGSVDVDVVGAVGASNDATDLIAVTGDLDMADAVVTFAATGLDDVEITLATATGALTVPSAAPTPPTGYLFDTSDPNSLKLIPADSIPPTTTAITRNGAAEDTNADTLTFRVTFSEDVFNVDAADFSVTGTTASITTINVVDARNYEVTVSGGDLASLNGTVGLDIAGAPTVADGAGNALATGEPGTDETYSVDNTSPTTSSITRSNPAGEDTNADTVVFRVTFSEDVANFDAGDLTVTGTTATISSVTPVTGSSVYDVTVSGGDLASLNGTVGLDIAGAPTVADGAGNALATGEPGTDETYRVDNTLPTTTSITRSNPAGEDTNADTVVFRVTFSEDVANFDAGDLTVTGTTATISAVTPVTGSSVYDVTVSGGDLASLNGAVGLDIAGAPTVADGAGNALATGEPGTDETYTLDNEAPILTSITRSNPAGELTNSNTLVFLATFAEDVQNLDITDFTVSGGSTAVVTNVNQLTASTYEITASGGDLAGYDGVVGLDLAGGQNLIDLAGNALGAGEPATDETYTLDNTAPTLTSITRSNPASELTNADTLVFLATFDEDIQPVDTGDFRVNGATTATVSSVVQVTASTYEITVSGGDLAGFNGPVGIDFDGIYFINDLAGNALPGGASEPATDETYTVDNVAPTMNSIERQTPGGSPTNADTLVFRVTFSEDVASFDAGDLTVTGTTATISSVTPVTGSSVYDVTVSGGDLASLNGAVGLDIAGAPTVADGADNALAPGEPGTDETYSVDNTLPTTTSITRNGAAENTNADSLVFLVTFSEDVFNVDAADFSVTGTTASVTSINAVDAQNYEVTVSGGDLASLNGTVGLNIAGAPMVVDVAGNALVTGDPGTDETYNVDNSSPAQTVVYVNDDWTQQSDILNSDGDIESTAVETATFGTNAFQTIAAAIAQLDTAQNGVVIVNAGDYSSETINMADFPANLTIRFVEGDSSVGTLNGGGGDAIVLGGFDAEHLTPVGLTVSSGTVSGPISGTGSLTKTGTGIFQIFGNGNTYQGGTVIDQGTLRVQQDGGLGATAGDITIRDTAILQNRDSHLNLNADRTITLEGTGSLMAGWSKTLTVNGQITGAGNLNIVNDSGTVFLMNTGNDWAGTTTLAGNLALGASEVIPDGAGAGNISVTTGTLDLNGFSETVNGISSNGGGTIDNTGATNATLTMGDQNQGGTLAGVIQDSGAGSLALFKTGGQSIIITGSSNTFTGGTTINQGFIRLNSDGGLGDPTSSLTLQNNGVLQNNNSNIDLHSDRQIILGGGEGRIRSGWSNRTVTVNGQVTGSGDLRLVNDSSVIVLANSTNNYTGDTKIGGNGSVGGIGTTGLVRLGAADAIPNGPGAGDVIFDAGPGGTVTLDLNGFSDTFNGLSVAFGSAVIENTTGSSTLTLGDADATSSFGGVIQENGGTIELTKIGNGTQTLTGANTYTGKTTVSDGTLAISGAGSIDNSSEIAIANGATIDVSGVTASPYTFNNTVSGAGTIEGDLTIGAGGNLVPGDSGVGILTQNGNLTVAGTLTLEVINAASDAIGVTGDLDLSAATLNIADVTPSASAYSLFSYTGTLAPGSFGGGFLLPAGYSLQFNANSIYLVSDTAGFEANDDINSVIEAGGSNNGTAGTVATGNVLGAAGASAGDVLDTGSGTQVVTYVTFGGTPFAGSTNSGGAVVAGSSTTVDGAYGTLTINRDGTYTYTVNEDAADVIDDGDAPTDVFSYSITEGTENPAVWDFSGSGAVNDIQDWTLLSGHAYTGTDNGRGDGLAAGTASGAHSYDDHGNVNPPFLASSPSISFNSGAANIDPMLTVQFGGGAGDQNNAGQIYNSPNDVINAFGTSPTMTNAAGQKGLALYNVGTGTYDTTFFKSTNGNPETLTFTAAELTGRGVNLSAAYQLHYFDNDSGSWGWTKLIDVSVNGLVGASVQNDTASLTITVNGADDDVVATLDTVNAVEAGESTGINPSGNVINDHEPDFDVDGDDGALSVTNIQFGGISLAVTGATNIAGIFGTLNIDSNGTYTYTVDQTAADSLDALDTVLEDFTYTLANGSGQTVTTTLRIVLTGANDAPVATNDVAAAAESGVGVAGSGASGNVLTDATADSDVDNDDVIGVNVLVDNIQHGVTSTAVSGATNIAGDFGTLTINPDGSYGYVVDQNAADSLDAGDTGSDVFTYQITDSAATAASWDFSNQALNGWQVLSGNEAYKNTGGFGLLSQVDPGIHGTVQDNDHETFLATSPAFAFDSTLTGADNALTLVFSGGDANGSQGGTPTPYANPAAMLAFNGTNSDVSGQKGVALYNVATGNYDVTIYATTNSNTPETIAQTIDGLTALATAQGGTFDKNAEYQLHFYDNDEIGWGWQQLNSAVAVGATTATAPVSTTATLTINIAGANDAPVFGSDANAATNEVAEGAATDTLVGITASFTDVDADDSSTLIYSLTDNAGGAFKIDSSTGVVSVADGTLIDYEAGTSLNITVQADDGNETATQGFTINVTNVASDFTIAATDADKAEGNSGNIAFTFTVSRTGDTSGAASVEYTVSGAADAADFGGTLPEDVVVSFANGETSKLVTINVSGDVDVEADELFTVTLNDASIGNTINATDSADGTIQTDDVPTDVIYVDAAWANQTAFDADGDADDGRAGIQLAEFGTNAFQTIADALIAVDPGGTIIVNGGIYNEDVSLAGTLTLEVTGPDSAEAVVLQSLETVTGTTVSIEGLSSLTVGDTSNRTIAGTVAGSGSFTKAGSGTLTLSGANTYEGATTVSAGTVILGSATALGGTTGETTVADGATLDLNGQTTAENLTITGAGVGGNGALVNSNTTTEAFHTGTIENAGFTVGGAGDIDLANVDTTVVNAFRTLTKEGTGTLTLSGATDNRFMALDAQAGVVELAKASSGAVHGAGTINDIATGATVRLAGTGGDQIFNSGAFTMSGGTLDLNGTSEQLAVLNGSGTVTNGSTATTSTLTVSGVANSTFSGVIEDGVGTVNLVKDGASTLTLSGTNTYTGTTALNTGTLILTGEIGNGGPAGAVSVNGTATLQSSGTIFANPINVAPGATLEAIGDTTIGNAGINAFLAGGFQGTLIVGAHTVTLNDSGLVTLGTSTIIDGGRLQGTNTGYTLAGGDTISGHGIIDGNVETNTGVIMVGDSGDPTETITINGNFTANGNIGLEVDGAAAGNFDQVIVNGVVNITGATLDTTGSDVTVAGTIVLIDNQGTDPVTGTFTGLAEGDTVTLNGAVFTISYNGGDGNDVVLEAGEPEINVQGDGQDIADGDVTPDSSDGTDFGAAVQGAANIVQLFTIQNTGIVDLDLTGSPNVTISGSSDFSVSMQPAIDPIAAAGSTTFEITFAPATIGIQTATVTILNNDADENVYTFTVTGEVTAPVQTDAVAPAPVLTTAAPSSDSPFVVTVNFGEPVTGFAIDDIVVNGGTVTGLIDNGAGIFTFLLSAPANSEVTVDIPAGAVSDFAGNVSTAATQLKVNVAGGEGVLIGEQVFVGGGVILEGFKVTEMGDFFKARDESLQREVIPIFAMPFYSGTAAPDSAVTVTIVGNNGSVYRTTVVAGSTGLWVAGFDALDIGNGDYYVEVQIALPTWNAENRSTFQTFYAPSLGGNYSELEQLTVNSVMGRQLSSVVMDDITRANLFPGISNSDWRKANGMGSQQDNFLR